VAKGEPGNGYPCPWLVYRWLEGEDALVADVADWCELARGVAAFATALQQIDPTNGPPARGRGGQLAPVDAVTRHAIKQLADAIDVDRAMAVWDGALAAGPWTSPPVWVHGDLLPGNVLVRRDRLVGIIDWSAAGVGDPACEAMLAWSLPADARAVYRATLGIDDATWARGRGWTLQQAVMFIPYYAATIPDGVAAAQRRLDAVLRDGAL
jgi:aminoglycoside phosphotransferase (APT) family kinase protein